MPRKTHWYKRREPQHSKNRKRPRRWHRGADQDLRFLKAVQKLS